MVDISFNSHPYQPIHLVWYCYFTNWIAELNTKSVMVTNSENSFTVSKPAVLIRRSRHMANQKWTVTMGNQFHLVEIDGGDWAMKGRVKVDNNPVKGWNQWLFYRKK